jgi:hypothetical protein
MKISFRKLSLGLLFFALCSAGFSVSAPAEETGKFYTKSNIWYEKSEKILSTNYHKGAMIPIGTKVEVLKSNRKKIEFRDSASGTVFKIKLVKKYTDLNPDEFFNRYFSKDNLLNSGEFNSLSPMEKEAVKAGRIEKDMSKAAVLLAYGYPPTHRTPSTDQDTWTYWVSRLGNFLVQFEGGKVTASGR